jgi:hypothetical protein
MFPFVRPMNIHPPTTGGASGGSGATGGFGYIPPENTPPSPELSGSTGPNKKDNDESNEV